MAEDEGWTDWYLFSLQPQHKIEHYRRSSMAELVLIPLPDYLHNARAKSLRPLALDAIEAYYKCDDDFDAFIPYLAMNYFDRVISRQNVKRVRDDEKNERPSVCDMLSYACLEDEEEEKLQKDYRKTEFNNMEFFIQETRRDGMRSLTPFSFVEYFISIFNLTGDQLSSTRKLVHQIIVTSQADMRIATFRPSLVAASAVYVVSKKLLPEQSSSMLQDELLRWDYITKQDLSTCKKMLQPICNAKVESWKFSSAKNDTKGETSSSGLGGTGQLARATRSSQPKPDEICNAQLGSPTGKETEGGAYGSGVQGASQVARASSSSLQELSTPGTSSEATIPRRGTDNEKESKRPMGEIRQDLTAGERPMEEIQQDPTPSQALAPASAGTEDLKLDFELGWSKYDELIREMTLATSNPHCCWIL